MPGANPARLRPAVAEHPPVRAGVPVEVEAVAEHEPDGVAQRRPLRSGGLPVDDPADLAVAGQQVAEPEVAVHRGHGQPGPGQPAARGLQAADRRRQRRVPVPAAADGVEHVARPVERGGGARGGRAGTVPATRTPRRSRAARGCGGRCGPSGGRRRSSACPGPPSRRARSGRPRRATRRTSARSGRAGPAPAAGWRPASCPRTRPRPRRRRCWGPSPPAARRPARGRS